MMTLPNETNVFRLVEDQLGSEQAQRLIATLVIDENFSSVLKQVTAAEMAMALNIVLFADILDRVPSGAAYVADRVSNGERILFDHGALRTIRFVDGPTGHLPAGVDAFARIIEPLGYKKVRAYPLEALRMTGYAWCHSQFPSTVPQFFVSELHVERFSEPFQAAAIRVFDKTIDPLPRSALETLDMFGDHGAVPFERAAAVLPLCVGAFGRHHTLCTLDDYEILLAESAEAAWIATEGNAFNHATDRVQDVVGLAERLRAEGKPIKSDVEFSSSGRVRQTALRADSVERLFLRDDGVVARTVPGSFYEFISRDVDAQTGQIDLTFDSRNAQGIFAMTRAA